MLTSEPITVARESQCVDRQVGNRGWAALLLISNHRAGLVERTPVGAETDLTSS